MSSGLIYVLDDDPDLAASVSRLLRRNGYAAEPFIDAEALLAAHPREPADCIVADVMMPQMSGFEFADALRRNKSTPAIIFMTGWAKTDDAVEAIRDHGGFDYIAKPLDEKRLVDAVSKALEHAKTRHQTDERLASLSVRERQVFDLIIQGHTNKEVALELGLSVRTVEDHRASVLRKTSTRSLAELIELSRSA